VIAWSPHLVSAPTLRTLRIEAMGLVASQGHLGWFALVRPSRRNDQTLHSRKRCLPVSAKRLQGSMTAFIAVLRLAGFPGSQSSAGRIARYRACHVPVSRVGSQLGAGGAQLEGGVATGRPGECPHGRIAPRFRGRWPGPNLLLLPTHIGTLLAYSARRMARSRTLDAVRKILTKLPGCACPVPLDALHIGSA
jgi:hypothetical protein